MIGLAVLYYIICRANGWIGGDTNKPNARHRIEGNRTKSKDKYKYIGKDDE